MSLSGYKVRTSIAVSDLARAAEFHEGSSASRQARTQADESRIAGEKGIRELGDGGVAWFTDPDGNTFAIDQ
jgi:hypothetical protein